jgi:hypothetical protein
LKEPVAGPEGGEKGVIYGVRDCVATGLTRFLPEDPFELLAGGEISMNSVTPGNRLIETYLDAGEFGTITAAATVRGYCTALSLENSSDDREPMDHVGNRFSDPYEAGDTYADDDENFTTSRLRFRECLTEYGMWEQRHPELPTPDFSYEMQVLQMPTDGVGMLDFYKPGRFRTGFSITSSYWTEAIPPPASPIYSANPSTIGGGGYGNVVHLEFSGRVAVIIGPSGNPFADDGRIFIGLFFHAEIDGASLGRGEITTRPSPFTSGATRADHDFILKLHGGFELRAPLYYRITDEDATYDSSGSTDWIFEATSWWPYAKGSPAEAVWDTTTGAKL